MSILIVEDNPINARVLEFYLQKDNYQTILAESAKEALKHLTSTPQIQLIIADIMMPEMDGLELLNKIKEHPVWKNIPIIMCSSLADMDTVKKAVDAGCKHYIIKPVKKEHLLTKIRETLEHEKPVLRDKNEIKSQLGLDDETYQEIVRTFASLISDKIVFLEKRIKGETEEKNSLDLFVLLESAIYLGAEKIRSFLEELTIKNEKVEEKIIDSDYPLLLRELKILQDALPSSIPNEVQTVKKENEKNDSEKKVAEDISDTSQKKNKTE